VAGATVGLWGRAGETTKGAGKWSVEAGGVIGNVMGGKEGKAVELGVVVGKVGEAADGGNRVGGDQGGGAASITAGWAGWLQGLRGG